MPRLTPGGVPSFLYSQFFVTPKLDRDISFVGQTVIVTGSNVGLGFSAAQQIAERGASKVILAVRTISKGEAAAQKLRDSLSQPQRTSTKIEVWPLNLFSYQSVRDFATRVNTLDRLDVLLENAGVVKVKFELEEGNEATITTNVISTTLLALLVLPKLRETAERFGVTPRLTIVSSEVAFWASFEERKAANIFDQLNDPNSNMQDRCADSTFGCFFNPVPSFQGDCRSFLIVLGTIYRNSSRTSSFANSPPAYPRPPRPNPSSSSTPSTPDSVNPLSGARSPVFKALLWLSLSSFYSARPPSVLVRSYTPLPLGESLTECI